MNNLEWPEHRPECDCPECGKVVYALWVPQAIKWKCPECDTLFKEDEANWTGAEK